MSIDSSIESLSARVAVLERQLLLLKRACVGVLLLSVLVCLAFLCVPARAEQRKEKAQLIEAEVVRAKQLVAEEVVVADLDNPNPPGASGRALILSKGDGGSAEGPYLDIFDRGKLRFSLTTDSLGTPVRADGCYVRLSWNPKHGPGLSLRENGSGEPSIHFSVGRRFGSVLSVDGGKGGSAVTIAASQKEGPSFEMQDQRGKVIFAKP